MASATCLTASKMSLLVGSGLRRSRFNLSSAFASALLCSGSSPSLSCMERRQSKQYCRFLSCFTGPPSPARNCRCRRAAPEKEWTEPKNSPNVCRTANNQHTPTNRLTDTKGTQRKPRGSPSMQRRTDGPQRHPVAAGLWKPPRLYAPRLTTRDSVLEAALSQRTCQRTCRIASSGDPRSI